MKKYNFFNHSGPIPEDAYLTESGTPYTIAQLKKLIETRNRSEDNKGRLNVNRLYPSKEAYLNTLYDVIFGYIDPGRLMTMEKSAIALRMTNGTGQFIKDYMFPKSKEDTVSTISEQLGAYREIKERVDDLEHRIEILDGIHQANLELVQVRADKERTEALLKLVEIESCRTRLAHKEEDLRGILARIEELEGICEALEDEKGEKTEELIEVKAKLQSSDYGVKKKELEDTKAMISLLAANSKRWREILNGLRPWEEEEEISSYVSNPTLQCLEGVLDGEVSVAALERLKCGLLSALDSISEELEDLNERIRETTRELSEKKEMVEDLKHDRKPYRRELKSARAQLQNELSSLYGRTIHVEIFADLFDITDERWKNAIEGRLGRIKHSLVTEPAYALDAAKIFRRMKKKNMRRSTSSIRRRSSATSPRQRTELCTKLSGQRRHTLTRA